MGSALIDAVNAAYAPMGRFYANHWASVEARNEGLFVLGGCTVSASATVGKVDCAAGVTCCNGLDTVVAAQSAQPGVATANATTVAAGSNAVHTNTFAGAGSLSVASTTGFPTAGTLMIAHSGTVSVITYTGVSGGNTFTGCTLANGTDVTMATSDTVVGSNADITNSRWAIYEVDLSGTLQLNLGSAATAPIIPALTASRVPVYWLYIPANATAIDSVTSSANGKAKLIDAREVVATGGPSGWRPESNTLTVQATTVAAGSNAVATSTFVGASTLNVASTTGFPTVGLLNVIHSGSVSQVSYTGTTSLTFTGCTLISGPTVTMATSDVVRLNGFTISSATDYSGRYEKGTRIKWSESGTIKYGNVGKVAFGSSVTSFSLVATSDYQVAAAPDAATAFFAPKTTSPTGYPTWFTYVPALAGWSSVPTNNVIRYKIDGTSCFINWSMGAPGTSNNAGHTATLPIVATTITNAKWTGLSLGQDNTAIQAGAWQIASAGTLMNFYGIITVTNTAAGSSFHLFQSIHEF